MITIFFIIFLISEIIQTVSRNISMQAGEIIRLSRESSTLASRAIQSKTIELFTCSLLLKAVLKLGRRLLRRYAIENGFYYVHRGLSLAIITRINGAWVVMAGSLLSPDSPAGRLAGSRHSLRFIYNRRDELRARDELDANNVLRVNVPFESPSTAARFITGKSSSEREIRFNDLKLGVDILTW
ncbi:MAG: DUF4357 domain-containing protein [Candidatus Lokiarchaeota archaeon]|nr:DUF4357 domain-containing protein [Candidatus Lokiarchaeota archaeon]